MKSEKNEKSETSPGSGNLKEEKQMGRRVAIKTIKYVTISAATMMVLMPSKAKADTSQLPGNPF
jgi:hypothetical protein